MSEQFQRQVIIRRPWWLEGIKEALRWLGLLILMGLVGCGIWYVFEWYGVAGFVLGVIVMTPVFYRLVKPAGSYVIEAKPTGEVNLFYFPDPFLEKWILEGDLKFSYHTRKGKPVLIADEVDFDNKLIRLAWSHELSIFEFMRHAEAFIWAREELHRQTMKNAKLELTLGELFALGVEENVEWALRPVLARLGIEEDEIERALKVLREVRPYAERAPGGSPESES